MASLEELEQEQVAPEFDEEEEQDEDDGQLQEAIALLIKANVLMSYMGDPELCKTITKRERQVMLKLGGKIYDYLEEVQA